MERKPLKILIYSDYYRQKSGYAREIRDIMPILKKLGHEVAHVALWYNGYPLETEYRTYHTQVHGSKDPWGATVLQYAVEDFDPDIVLTNQDYFPLRHIAFEMSHPMRAKWIHWGLMDGKGLDFDAEGPVKWVHKHIYKTGFTKREVESFDERLTGKVINPPLNQSNFYELPNKKELRAEYGLDNVQTVFCMARPQLRKNLPALFEAMKIVINKKPNTVLIMAATHIPKDFDGSYTAHDIERFIKKFDIESNVIIPRNKDATPLTDEVMNIQYNLADVNVLTSFGEGFGLSVIESGICGVPSIGVNSGALTEVIGERGWLVDPAAHVYSANGVSQAVVRPQDVAEKILEALDNDYELKVRGALAKEFAQTLTPESRAEQLLDVFYDTIEKDVKPVALQ